MRRVGCSIPTNSRLPDTDLRKPSINLAYAELYIVIAGIFRKYDLYDSAIKQKTPTLALYETTREQDVDVEYDYLIPFPKSENRGIRLLVR